MKKKAARNLVLGDQLVMVRDGSYNACFKSGDIVIFDRHKNSQKMDVLGLWEGRELAQTIDRKDVEPYKQTPCDALGYKVGDLFLVVGDNQRESFVAGSIVELVEDDGSYFPYFKLVTGTRNGCLHSLEYFPLSLVRPHTKRPHEALREKYKAGQEWEFKMPFSEDWHDCGRLKKPTEPLWHEGREYRLKPQTSPQKIIGAGPEPLEAELYCVVAGYTDRMFATRAMALLECQKKVKKLYALFPEQNYRVMRLVPHDNNADVTVQK